MNPIVENAIDESVSKRKLREVIQDYLMSTANITQFVQAVTRDQSLQERVRSAVAASTDGKSEDAIAAVARAHGYDIAPEELTKAGLVDALTELDLKQLDAVSGGNYSSYTTNSPFDD